MSRNEWLIVGVVCLVGFLLLIVLPFGGPLYNVWNMGKLGEAKLKQAEQEKQILIEQAKAEVEAAKLRAEAIEIVGESAQKYPEYRLQEFLGAFGEALNNGEVDQIIYVPTEANIPIMEAGRATGDEDQTE